jgi:hypothetical protein
VLAQKKAMVDCHAFGLFKQAWLERLGPEMASLGKGLGWGVGLGLPALGVGHLLATDTRRQGEALIRDARNQALLTAAGLGGAKTLMDTLTGAMQPKTREETSELTFPDTGRLLGHNVLKFSEDASLRKLAAVMLLDGVLEQQLEKSASDDRHTVEECLLINRSVGTGLLRELLR